MQFLCNEKMKKKNGEWFLHTIQTLCIFRNQKVNLAIFEPGEERDLHMSFTRNNPQTRKWDQTDKLHLMLIALLPLPSKFSDYKWRKKQLKITMFRIFLVIWEIFYKYLQPSSEARDVFISWPEYSPADNSPII